MATITNDRGGKQSRIEARFTSIPPNALRLVAECFGFGAQKYGDENWHNIPVREHLDHALNHVNEYRRGDAGEMHLVNNAVRALMALEMAVREESHPVSYSHPDMEAGDGSDAETVSGSDIALQAAAIGARYRDSPL
jgi:hypothetical protein